MNISNSANLAITVAYPAPITSSFGAPKFPYMKTQLKNVFINVAIMEKTRGGFTISISLKEDAIDCENTIKNQDNATEREYKTD